MDNLYLNNNFCDIVFYVGENKTNAVRFPAHKCVLTFVSPVFAVMFGDNNFIESKSGEVLLTDVPPNAFNALLYFAYTRRLKTHNVVELSDILYIAKKYLVTDLTQKCFRQLLKKSITIDNFWHFYTILRNFFTDAMPADIVFRTKEFLTQNTMHLLQHVDFENLDYDLINAVIENRFLNPNSEMDIFNAVVNWAQKECCRQNLDPNPCNQRFVLKDIVYKIRFFLMTRTELRNGPIASKILTPEEGKMLLEEYLKQEPTVQSPWNCKLLRAFRNRKSLTYWDFLPTQILNIYEGETSVRQRLAFVSSYNIVLTSLVIYALPIYRKIEINCELKDMHGVLVKEWTYSKNCKTDKEVRIRIDKPICLTAFKCYELKMHCIRGEISGKRFDSATCFNFNEKSVLCIRSLPNVDEDKFKSMDFWQKLFDSDSVLDNEIEDSTCLNEIEIAFF